MVIVSRSNNQSLSAYVDLIRKKHIWNENRARSIWPDTYMIIVFCSAMCPHGVTASDTSSEIVQIYIQFSLRQVLSHSLTAMWDAISFWIFCRWDVSADCDLFWYWEV